MEYYAKIKKTSGAYMVSFPEFPNVNTYGNCLESALNNASEALNGCLESDFERGYHLPDVKVYNGRNYHKVRVLPHIEIAYKLKKLRNGKSQIEIAKKLKISYQAYQKLENPRKCNPTIKTLEKISNALGKEVVIRFK